MKHRWSDKVDFPLANNSERTCTRGCGWVKLKRHEYPPGSRFGTHWTEYWRELDKFEGQGTPACEPVAAEIAVA